MSAPATAELDVRVVEARPASPLPEGHRLDGHRPPVEVEVATAQGVVRGDLYLPAEAKLPAPLLVAASPYQKALMGLPSLWTFPFRETGPVGLYLDEGYGFLWVDVPGSGRSEGRWDPVSRAEGEAVAEVVEWAADQSWCSGSVAMYGQSYYCWSAWNVARVRPPHLAAVVAFDGATDMYRDWMYHGGIPVLTFVASWTTTTMLQHQWTGHDIAGGDRHLVASDIYRHVLDDPWQRQRSPFWELDQVDVPVLSVGCWGKGPLHLRGNVMGFGRLRGPKQLLLTTAMSFPQAQALFADAAFHRAEILPFVDRYLKQVDNGADQRPTVRYRPIGGLEQRTASTWPPEGTSPVQWVLTTEPEDGDPGRPVGSLYDGGLAEGGAAADGPATGVRWHYPDPRWRAGTTVLRADGTPDHVAGVLTFTTEPFDRARELVGDGHLLLFCSTDQTDMDVYAKLSVLPAGASGHGEATRVTQGWLRLSHRDEDPGLSTALRPFHSHQRIEPLVPGQRYRVRVELLPMAFVVHPGERLRLELSNGDSSATEGLFHHWYGLKQGSDTYFLGGAVASRLVLSERISP